MNLNCFGFRFWTLMAAVALCIIVTGQVVAEGRTELFQSGPAATDNGARVKRAERIETCLINVRQLGYDHALILEYDENQAKFIYPQQGNMLKLQAGEILTLSCPGPDNFIAPLSDSKTVEASFRCIKDAEFSHTNSGRNFNFQELKCAQPPKFQVREIPNFGHPMYRKFQIGFPLCQDCGFLDTIEVYFDESRYRTKFVKQYVPHTIAGKQKTAASRRFDDQPLERKVVDFYNAAHQVEVFQQLLNCQNVPKGQPGSCVEDYINSDTNKELYFSRGHLAAKSHFIYEIAGASSFFYLNVGPQYQIMNKNNWGRIEEFVVKLATDKKLNLFVYTGSYGHLKLPDKADGNREKEIYLGIKEDGSGELPVPLYFWKLLYDPEHKRGVVFVVVNNPFIQTDDYKICRQTFTDYGSSKRPSKWNPKSYKNGFSYMCKVDDFLQTTGIDIIDNLDVQDVLIYEK